MLEDLEIDLCHYNIGVPDMTFPRLNNIDDLRL